MWPDGKQSRSMGLLAKVWRIDPTHVSTRTIDMHVARLREKLRDQSQAVLVTVRGKGYMVAESALSAESRGS